MAGQIQNQNQRQPQSNRQAVPATGNSQPDELKGLGMMMQQLLQGMQIQGKSLNQVSTDITTRMDNMFTELNKKYDTLSNHIKMIDVQLSQTAESVKRQQELRCEKAEEKDPEQLSAETAPGAEERTEQPASSEVIPPVQVYVPKVPYPIPPKHLMDPIREEQLAGFNKMELADKSEIKEVLDGDPHAYTKKLNGDERVNEKVQRKRIKGDPTVTLIPLEDDNAYDLGPLDDDTDDAAYRRWMVDSQRKSNSLLKRILKAITGGCMGAPSIAEPCQEQPTPSNRHPGKVISLKLP
ncbi:hypothetical protein F2Q68_00015164 [Brassica cretica]|uniref:Uncharacterized protein n=1 Tax=Brassica cretica TaxID=69181 RepID=A0A8S9HU49_BRACR|nr:hypothetical protein F2Q68_00015164 [Brassica cretica]